MMKYTKKKYNIRNLVNLYINMSILWNNSEMNHYNNLLKDILTLRIHVFHLRKI